MALITGGGLPSGGDAGPPGADGLSAYEIAVENGFVGTEEQWLASLKGEPGADAPAVDVKGWVPTASDLPADASDRDAYISADDGHFHLYYADTDEWRDCGPVVGPPGEQGEQGASAYEIAVAEGYKGTQEEWLASLQGEPGEQGEQGDQGDQGETGEPGPPRDSLYGDLQPADPSMPPMKYDDSWLMGGETGWVLTKRSNADRDAEWAPAGSGGGGLDLDPLGVARLANPIGTIIPYAGDWGTDYANLASRAPFHLPCTGGLYQDTDFPELSQIIGHTYIGAHPPMFAVDTVRESESRGVNGYPRPENINPDTGEEVGEVIWVQGGDRKEAWEYHFDYSSWKRQDPLPDGTMLSAGWAQLHESSNGYPIDAATVCMVVGDEGLVEVLARQAFVVPDMQGRSPIGAGGGGVARKWELGERWGDGRPQMHAHDIVHSAQKSRNTERIAANDSGGVTRTWAVEIKQLLGKAESCFHATQFNLSEGTPEYGWAWPEGVYDARGLAENYQPSTACNWLIFTGVEVASHAPMSTDLRDGSVYEMKPMTNDQLVYRHLSNPNLGDEGRATFEALLSGEAYRPAEPSEEDAE